MVHWIAVLFFIPMIFSYVPDQEYIEKRMEQMTEDCKVDQDLCLMSSMQMAVYMENLGHLIFAHEKESSTIEEFASKSENVIQPLLNVNTLEEAKDFSIRHGEQLREIHKQAVDLYNLLPPHEQDNWSSILDNLKELEKTLDEE